MFKVIKTFRLALFILFTCILTSGVAQAAALNNVFEAIVGNSFKKAGKNLDNISELRRTENSFSRVLRKNGDLLDVRKISRKGIDDDLLNIRKIGFPPGSHHADDLMKLSKNQRVLAYALDDVTSRIARLPQANDIVKVTGPKGLLLGAVYGDDALIVTYRLVKKDEIWDMARASKRALNGDVLKALEKNDKLLAFIDVNAIRRVDNIDAVDMSGAVLKKYGDRGQDSISRFFDWVEKHPKTTLMGLCIVTVYAKPDIILDAAGYLKDEVLEKLSDAMASVASGVISLPSEVSHKIVDKISSDLPPFFKNTLVYILTFFIAMGLLFLIPFTSFIPRSVFSWIKQGFRAISRHKEVAESNNGKQ